MSILNAISAFAEKIFPTSFLLSTDDKLRSTYIALSGPEYCGITFFMSLAAGLAIWLLSFFIQLPLLPEFLYGVVGFVLIFVLITMIIPYFLIQRRVNDIEDALPDALRQMSNVLRAGVGMDVVLEDISESDYGPLSEEFERTIDQVQRGRSMRHALRAMAERSKSDLLERAFFLIVEGMERGAELADVMEAVSGDIRETQTLQRERRAATMQQVLFLLAATLFVAPLISGLVLSVSDMFAVQSGGGGGSLFGGGMSGDALPDSIYIVLPIFIIIQAFITSLAVGVIRYGKLSKGVIFSGPFMIGAVGVFYAARVLADFFMTI
ncbi:MAG: type II secretion system F family protein [Candidatus Hadarchaeia archaeon]